MPGPEKGISCPYALPTILVSTGNVFLDGRREPPQARRPEIMSRRTDPAWLAPRFGALCVELEPDLLQI